MIKTKTARPPIGRERYSHGTPRRILYVVNDCRFFVSHRLDLALAARDQGFSVHVMALEDETTEKIREHGLTHHAMRIDRTGLAPWQDASMLVDIFDVVRRVKPTIMHCVTVKAVCYGGIVARALRVPGFVAAVTGLGQFLGGSDKKMRLAKALALPVFRTALAHPNTRVIFQNQDDLAEFVRQKLLRIENTVLIRGSGVDPRQYRAIPEPSGRPIILLSGRLIWAKGIGEFVAAARCLRAAGLDARFVIVGEPPAQNRDAVPVEILKAWHAEGCIEWWGYRRNMAKVYAQSNVVCLPSVYREGVPKALIEAASCGRALISTDMPGCRDICRHGINGLLVPPNDLPALVAALATLVADDGRRRQMGIAGRGMVEAQFSLSHVLQRTLDVYRNLGPELKSISSAAVNSARIGRL